MSVQHLSSVSMQAGGWAGITVYQVALSLHSHHTKSHNQFPVGVSNEVFRKVHAYVNFTSCCIHVLLFYLTLKVIIFASSSFIMHAQASDHDKLAFS